MEVMPRPRPPYLQRHQTRHGKSVWYVRIGRGPLIRLREAFGSPEFQAAYEAAVRGEMPMRVTQGRSGSVRWLWERYREVDAWKHLSSATRRQRENIMAGVLKTIGDDPCRSIRRADIVASRDKRVDTPAQARNFLDAMRGLFRWGLEAGHVLVDPTAGVKNPARQTGGGFPVWTEDDVARYQVKWPIGTMERVWLDVLLYTGLRRGDAVRLGRQHVKDGIAVLRTEKSQDEVTVTIPILPVLQVTLAAGPCADLAFICGDARRPLTKETFGNFFRAACNTAGVAKSAHGVRKIGATRAAENGATVAELEAIFGWSGGGMAALYTRAADRARLSKGAIFKMQRGKTDFENSA